MVGVLDTPSEPNVLLDLNNWWIERRVNCREALNAGQARIAYEIADYPPLAPVPRPLQDRGLSL